MVTVDLTTTMTVWILKKEAVALILEEVFGRLRYVMIILLCSMNILTLQITKLSTGALTIQQSRKDNADWQTCLEIKNATLPSYPFVGFSAATGGVADLHEILRYVLFLLLCAFVALYFRLCLQYLSLLTLSVTAHSLPITPETPGTTASTFPAFSTGFAGVTPKSGGSWFGVILVLGVVVGYFYWKGQKRGLKRF